MSALEILIVEDHPFQRMYLQEMLNELGEQRVDVARDGIEALSRLQQHDYDLITTDLLMPGMDGVQFIQHLAALPGKPSLAILSMASSRMLMAASLAARHLGGEVLGVLPKPVTVEALRGVLERLREGRRSLTQTRTCVIDPDRQTLLDGLNRRALQAWFQPKQSLSSGRIVAAEALVRWMHPEQGMLLPGAFLPAINAFGLEEHLLWMMLEQSLDAQARWRAQGDDIPVSINLPTHLLGSHDLADRLLEFVLNREGIPGKICFELMECSLPDQIGNYYAGACRLRIKGFGLSQDDFGKGYSSYMNLISTPFTELKIDRGLVQGCHTNDNLASALASIIALGRELGLNVVAEGVETPEELALLSKLGCSQVQGFLVSHAVPPEQFLQLLKVNGRATGY